MPNLCNYQPGVARKRADKLLKAVRALGYELRRGSRQFSRRRNPNGLGRPTVRGTSPGVDAVSLATRGLFPA